MPPLLVLLFIVVPLVELAVILQVGAAIGGWWTALTLLGCSVVGAWLLRVEGARAWGQFRTALTEGRWPGDEVVQGALVLVGGSLLLTPGFLTDGVGFLLLLAPTRRRVAGVLRRRFAAGAFGVPGDARRASGRRGASARRGSSAGRGSSARRPTSGPRAARPGGGIGRDTGQDVVLDVEVVEIERDQPPPIDGDRDRD